MWIRIVALIMVIQGISQATNSSDDKILRILVLLPYTSSEFKFPFGAEMCGSAGKRYFIETE